MPIDFLNKITIDTLYLLALLIPMLFVPVVLPAVVLMARRKRMTDKPNARKLQDQPVVVMGGTVIVLALCTTLIILNLFYDINTLLPVVCVMLILYIFGMLDDNIGLKWYSKLILQIFFILLLFWGGNYGVHTLHGLVSAELPVWFSCLLTIFVGVLILNAVNFIDGIDGLASGLGVMTGLIMAYWNIKHGIVDQALISFAMVGALFVFFIFNVFSNKFKMYMGDSGSLVLGLFVFISACPSSYYVLGDEYLADNYFVSFFIALLSAMVFDLVRVVIVRVFSGSSPFTPDRRHLHHIFVDMGMSHLLATLMIVLLNLIVLSVWHLTASAGMNTIWQFWIVVMTGLFLFWLPYFQLTMLRDKHPKRYESISAFWLRVSGHIDNFSQIITRLIDGRKTFFTHVNQ